MLHGHHWTDSALRQAVMSGIRLWNALSVNGAHKAQLVKSDMTAGR